MGNEQSSIGHTLFRVAKAATPLLALRHLATAGATRQLAAADSFALTPQGEFAPAGVPGPASAAAPLAAPSHNGSLVDCSEDTELYFTACPSYFVNEGCFDAEVLEQDYGANQLSDSEYDDYDCTAVSQAQAAWSAACGPLTCNYGSNDDNGAGGVTAGANYDSGSQKEKISAGALAGIFVGVAAALALATVAGTWARHNVCI